MADSRLRVMQTALAGGNGSPTALDFSANLRPEPYAIATQHSVAAPPALLDDQQVQQFLVDGFCVIDADFGAEPVHEAIVGKLGATIQRMGNPGNNLLAVCPDIQKVFDHPRVRGAVQSLVGPDAYLHPHTHCHDHQPGAGDQHWHKDEYNYDANLRSPQPRWIFALYYPGRVTAEMVSTALPVRYVAHIQCASYSGGCL
jgi:hypothetical protein